MKQITFLKATLFSSLLFTTIAAHTQTQEAVASLNLSTKKVIDIVSDAPAIEPSGAAFTAFRSIFPSATEYHWYTEKKGNTSVYFKTPGRTNRVSFTKKGKIDYSISYYQKEMLPFGLLQMVNEKYLGKTIFGVTEITNSNGTTYVLVLEGKTSWLDVTIVGNQIQDEQEWHKSNP